MIKLKKMGKMKKLLSWNSNLSRVSINLDQCHQLVQWQVQELDRMMIFSGKEQVLQRHRFGQSTWTMMLLIVGMPCTYNHPTSPLQHQILTHTIQENGYFLRQLISRNAASIHGADFQVTLDKTVLAPLDFKMPWILTISQRITLRFNLLYEDPISNPNFVSNIPKAY